MEKIIAIILTILLGVTAWRMCKGSSRNKDDHE
jgi:hypothetical protein